MTDVSVGELMAEENQPRVSIELVELDASGHRQISRRRKVTALLRDRRDDIHAAIVETVKLMQTVQDDSPKAQGWRVGSIEASFGITLTTEAGVLISRVSGEASLGVTIRLERAG